MEQLTEKEVAMVAYFMGYSMMKGENGYALHRKSDALTVDVVEAESLEELAHFLKH